MPEFSLVVAAYNMGAYVSQCLDSLLAQTFEDFEVIIVDDGSTDDTASVIERYSESDRRIRILHQPMNMGTHLARKRGVESASGRWIVFVDADDELESHALRTLHDAVTQNSRVELAYFSRTIIPEEGAPEDEADRLEKDFCVEDGLLDSDDAIRQTYSNSDRRMLMWTVISMMIPRELARRAFDVMGDVRLGRMEDAFEFLVLLSQTSQPLMLMSDRLLRYHWGRGVTGAQRMELGTFEAHVQSMRGVYDCIHDYASSLDTASVKEADQWLSTEIPRHISTEMVLRVNPDEEEQAALAFARAWGSLVVESELNRLIIDRATGLRENETAPGQKDELWRLRRIRDMVVLGGYPGVDNPRQRASADDRRRKADGLLTTAGGGDVPTDGRRIDTETAKRLAIFCFYDRQGHAARFIPRLLDDLMRNVSRLVVVVNGLLDDESREMFGHYTDTIIVRENIGLDIAAYQETMLRIGWSRLTEYDEVICLNDTCLGPVYPFAEMFRTMDRRPVDFWGITAYAGETVNGEDIPTHIQSYWHAYRRSLVSSSEFQSYWQNMPVFHDYAQATRKHEMTFTKHFEDLGFTWDSYVDWRAYADQSSYPLLYMPLEMVRDARCPVFKRRVFFVEYEFVFDQTAGQGAMDLYRYLHDHSIYDVDLIWDALVQSYNVEDIRKAMHLDYVLPTRALNPVSAQIPRSAFIFHVFFLDLLDDTIRYIRVIPEKTDIYVTTNPEKVDAIRNRLRDEGLKHRVTFITVVNRGRDVSALLIAARDVVLSGRYDVIGFAHDKKSGQNQDTGHHGTETRGFAYKLLENTLGSRNYVRNILGLFADNPRLGQVSPPPPFHALYFAHTRPSDWGPDYDITRDLLENRLNIHVPLDPAKATMSAIGSCYWFRVDALRPLFEYPWKYEDFLPEGEMGGDGSVSHAIERANGYVAQSRGYYPAWVVSDRYARIEIDSALHTTDVLLKALGPDRAGETLLQTAGALSMQIGSPSRHPWRWIHRHAHLLLQWFTHHVIQPLPDPIEDSVYRSSWYLINVIRRAKASFNVWLDGQRRRRSR